MSKQEMVFKNRAEAGRMLTAQLGQYRDKDALVLALPRGGVPVAAEVASVLNAELDIIIAKKIGAPGNPELAIGAVTSDGAVFLNDSLIATLDVGEGFIDQSISRVKCEIAEYIKLYRGDRPVPRIAGRIVIIVDDGIATGYTALAAAQASLKRSPRELVIAVPVAQRESANELEKATGCQVITVAQPTLFIAVGQFYEDFEQVADEQVRSILDDYYEARIVKSNKNDCMRRNS